MQQRKNSTKLWIAKLNNFKFLLALLLFAAVLIQNSSLRAQNSPAKTAAPLKTAAPPKAISDDEDDKEDPADVELKPISSATFAEKLKAAGFECRTDAAKVKVSGYMCRGKLKGYSDFVRLYIPEKLENSMDLIVHMFFHGLRRPDTFAENDTDGKGFGDYGAMLKESQNTSSVIFIPESQSDILSYQEFVKNPELIFKLFEQIDKIAAVKLEYLSLTAHGSSYQILDSILANKKVAEKVGYVALFDAVSGDLRNVSPWLKLNKKKKLFVSWLTGPSATTEKQTQKFLAALKSSGADQGGQITQTPLKASNSVHHMNIMQNGGFREFLEDAD